MLFFYLAALPVVVAAVVTALLWLPSKTTGWLVRLDVGKQVLRSPSDQLVSGVRPETTAQERYTNNAGRLLLCDKTLWCRSGMVCGAGNLDPCAH